MMKLKSFSRAGEPAAEVDAPGIFSVPASMHVVHLAVLKELANARAGTHASKTRGFVSGGGRKPWRQKHTGQARQGSRRAPQWRHGAVIFGPQPRKHTQELPRAARLAAMRAVLADRIRSGRALVLEEVALEAPRTRHAVDLIRKLDLGGTTLLVLPVKAPEVARAFRNLDFARVEYAASVSVYDIVRHRNLVLVGGSLGVLARRCGEGEA